MEQGNKKVLIIAVLLALVTSGLIFTYLKKIESANKNIEYVNIPVAARTIEARSTIILTDIKEIKIEKSIINSTAILNKNDILGRTLKETVYEGEQILSTRLANKENSSLSYQIPQGKRAVTININEASAVGYFINPGDYVDVIVTLEKDSQDQTVPIMAKTIVQNAIVLGMGQERNIIEKVEDKIEKKNLQNSSSAQTETTKTVTLAVTQQEAEKISMSEQAGSIRLTLRRVGDSGIENTTGITKRDLVQ